MTQARIGLDIKTSTREPEERRYGAAPRVYFETLVEVGARQGGFEAESVDVSADGIRLRTAFLPNPGDKLTCRFDGVGGEVIATGEVMWCRDEGRGGEFGLRFISLDQAGAQVLESLCRPETAVGPEPARADELARLIGSRVRLHIQGLGTPMRARVRDLADGEVLVGSNLEFLRVGRDIELEDVEQGGRRVALIEHVGVEIDPETSVPQLVVSLRYDEAMRAKEPAPRIPTPARREPAAVAGRLEREVTPEPTVIDDDEPVESPVSAWSRGPEERTDDTPHMARRAVMPEPSHEASALATESGGSEAAGDGDAPPTLATPSASTAEETEAEGPATRAIATLGRALGGYAKAVGPKLTNAGVGAKATLAQILEAVKRKRAERDVAEPAAKAPKRTTALPPTGALRSDGKRLVRESVVGGSEADAGATDASRAAPRTADRRRATVGAIAGAIAVVGIYVGATQLNKPRTDAAVSPTAAVAAAPGEPGSSPAGALQPAAPRADGGGVAMANVPLFGATPLTTTEAVPAAKSPDLLGDSGALDGAAPPAGADGAQEGEPAPKAATLQKEWGVGNVEDPVVLRLTMDDDVAGFSGLEGEHGFTLVVPGCKSISSAAALARKDKRIDSLNVVNYPDRAEITVEFKGDVPAYLAKVSGKRLSIEIAGDPKSRGDERDEADEPKPAKKKSKSKSKAKDGDAAEVKSEAAAGKPAKAAKKTKGEAKASDSKARAKSTATSAEKGAEKKSSKKADSTKTESKKATSSKS